VRRRCNGRSQIRLLATRADRHHGAVNTKKPKKPGKVARPRPDGRGPAPLPAASHPSYADLVRIVDVLRSTERFSEFRLKAGDIEIEVKRSTGTPSAAPVVPAVMVTATAPSPVAPVPAPVAAAAAPTVELASLPPGLELVRAPSMGVFYRSPKPGAPPFVEPGSRVEADSTVGLVEVMKLFSSVLASCAGTVTHVLAADGAAVVEGQPLVAVRPGS